MNRSRYPRVQNTDLPSESTSLKQHHNWKKHIQENQDKYLKQLIELLKIPSISADPSYTADVRKAAVWVGDALEEAGCDNIEIIATLGHPIVYAEKILNADFQFIFNSNFSPFFDTKFTSGKTF